MRGLSVRFCITNRQLWIKKNYGRCTDQANKQSLTRTDGTMKITMKRETNSKNETFNTMALKTFCLFATFQQHQHIWLQVMCSMIGYTSYKIQPNIQNSFILWYCEMFSLFTAAYKHNSCWNLSNFRASSFHVVSVFGNIHIVCWYLMQKGILGEFPFICFLRVGEREIVFYERVCMSVWFWLCISIRYGRIKSVAR